jgi:hypothetical protein
MKAIARTGPESVFNCDEQHRREQNPKSNLLSFNKEY